MNRREFKPAVIVKIVNRAMDDKGRVVCEGCGLVLGDKLYHIDHTIPDAMAIDKSRDLMAEDGKLLGWHCCHKPKTAKDQGDIAKVKRIERKRLGIRPRSTFRKPPPGVKYDWKLGRHVKEAT